MIMLNRFWGQFWPKLWSCGHEESALTNIPSLVTYLWGQNWPQHLLIRLKQEICLLLQRSYHTAVNYVGQLAFYISSVEQFMFSCIVCTDMNARWYKFVHEQPSCAKSLSYDWDEMWAFMRIYYFQINPYHDLREGGSASCKMVGLKN